MQEDIPVDYMVLTDTLDMVGVQLCALWSKSRQKNGLTLQNKVSTMVGAWKAGKFMPLTSRPYSINSFIFSKVWFKCHTVNIRECDIKSLSSTVKKWLYADLLVKPEEKVLYRKPSDGCLGLHSVRQKSTACFLRNFMELAANPSYRGILYLSCIYRHFVLKEDIPCPRLPPYLSLNMLSVLESAKASRNDIISFRMKQ